LPGAESDDRPLVALFASPWLGAHDVYAGAPLSRRGAAAQPAIIGELLWPLWPGPVNRWDQGNVVRIRLYDGALASVSQDAVLAGGNVFAIESENDEWEVVQARMCELVAPNEYQFSNFLRGQLGSAHAMRAPHPAGARIVRLDSRLARADIGAHEWREALNFVAPPANGASSDPRAVSETHTLPHAAARPWAPAHMRALRLANDDVTISWIRCARSGGDAWGEGEPPLGAPSEAYRLEILDGVAVKRTVNVSAPEYLYEAGDQAADFGGLPGSFQVRVAQIDANGATGLNAELTITL
jgi:hypothetical protein